MSKAMSIDASLPLLPGLAAHPAVLIDVRSRPDFRDVFVALARGSADVAGPAGSSRGGF